MRPHARPRFQVAIEMRKHVEGRDRDVRARSWQSAAPTPTTNRTATASTYAGGRPTERFQRKRPLVAMIDVHG